MNPATFVEISGRNFLETKIGDKAPDPLTVAPRERSNARYRVRTCDPYRVKVVLYH
jgi:hypothetical protein